MSQIIMAPNPILIEIVVMGKILNFKEQLSPRGIIPSIFYRLVHPILPIETVYDDYLESSHRFRMWSLRGNWNLLLRMVITIWPPHYDGRNKRFDKRYETSSSAR